MKKSDFYYDLPSELIAQKPLPQRSASRMLRLERATGCVRDDLFQSLIDVLCPGDLLVFNNTRVIPARLFAHKRTGGRVEILIERIESDAIAIAHVKASKSPKSGAELLLENGEICVVLGREGDLFKLRFHTSMPLLQLLEHIGHLPLPPYIDRADEREDFERYQTVFASQAGAVAAPTAGLHFDEGILARLEDKGIAKTFVTLHVGSGTFQPVRVENLSEHVMHQEFYDVPQAAVCAIEKAHESEGRVIAVGTTAVRALESAARHGRLQAGSGDTRLFITPGFHFRVIDGLLTNFHLPESTLLMLISAFAGYENVMSAYRHAIEQRYRFFSYGDAMLII